MGIHICQNQDVSLKYLLWSANRLHTNKFDLKNNKFPRYFLDPLKDEHHLALPDCFCLLYLFMAIHTTPDTR